MRAPAHPPPDQLTLPSVLHALSDPVRLEIVRALHEGKELSCGELGVPVSKSTLSHHLRVLRDAGLTQTRALGTKRFVSLRRDELEARFPGLVRSVVQELARSA